MACKKSVAIIGGGPIGIELAARLITLNIFERITLFERGSSPGHNICLWSHVRLFSPWSLNASPWGRSLLDISFDEAYCPTGLEFLDQYLLPLSCKARELGVDIRLDTQVLSISKQTVLIGHPQYYLFSRSTYESEINDFADIIFDTTGTFGNFNRLGPGGAPALGELMIEEEGRIHRMIPSIDESKSFCAIPGSKIVCVGTGYSAITTLSNIIEAARQSSFPCELIWISRKGLGRPPYSIIENDSLPARSDLSLFGNSLALGQPVLPENLTFKYLPETIILGFSSRDAKISLSIASSSGETTTLFGFTHLIANVGYKPNLDIFRELNVHLCYQTEGPMRLASSLLSDRAHRDLSGESPDCLTQSSFGPSSLVTTEPGFYILGAKSYGRLTTFILRIGIQQIIDIVNLLESSIVL
jgi:hypothetical protein